MKMQTDGGSSVPLCSQRRSGAESAAGTGQTSTAWRFAILILSSHFLCRNRKNVKRRESGVNETRHISLFGEDLSRAG